MSEILGNLLAQFAPGRPTTRKSGNFVTGNLCSFNFIVILAKRISATLPCSKTLREKRIAKVWKMAMPIRNSPEPRPDSNYRNQQSVGSTENTNKTNTNVEHNAALQGTDFGAVTKLPVTSHFHSSSAEFSCGAPILPHDVSASLTFGFELVRYGAMLVAAEGNIRLANRAALAILSKQDGLLLDKTRLFADRASDTRLLLKVVQDAIQAPEYGEPPGSPITLPRKMARSSLVVRVVPGPTLDCYKSEVTAVAMVMVYDHDIGFEVNVSLLSKLYGLTRAEAVLATILIKGKSIDEAAKELFVSPHTARTHLKRIFMKTDTHRQTELVVRAFPAVL